eukprot:TRINITY_DN3084_c1_g1_i5.p1 TRINITY_DN3084_c1_g1~~TRINITY_DN3084_c1_g1_i5.p1  ORF type:complete len:267 (+),score=9.29 TRINITY_DN3084_c1_g1_i5:863-1663(+)
MYLKQQNYEKKREVGCHENLFSNNNQIFTSAQRQLCVIMSGVGQKIFGSIYSCCVYTSLYGIIVFGYVANLISNSKFQRIGLKNIVLKLISSIRKFTRARNFFKVFLYIKKKKKKKTKKKKKQIKMNLCRTLTFSIPPIHLLKNQKLECKKTLNVGFHQKRNYHVNAEKIDQISNDLQNIDWKHCNKLMERYEISAETQKNVQEYLLSLENLSEYVKCNKDFEGRLLEFYMLEHTYPIFDTDRVLQRNPEFFIEPIENLYTMLDQY